MTRFFRKQFAKIKQRKVQQNYDSENPPIFSLSPEFTPLTYDQRQLLFFLVKASKEEAYHGEFQWCVETVPASLPPAHFITGIKPVDSKTRLIDRTNPLFQGKDWKMVGKYGQMKTLENAGYISISSFFEHIIDEKNHKEEKWARFCLNQKHITIIDL